MSKNLEQFDITAAASLKAGMKLLPFEPGVWKDEFLCYLLDEQGHFTRVGDSVRDLLGIAPEDLVGKPSAQILNRNHSTFSQLGSISDISRLAAVSRGSGEIAYFELHERDIEHSSAGNKGKVGIGVDVTHSIRAALEVKQSELTCRRLVEKLNGDYFIYSYDPSGRLSYVSPSVFEVLGYMADEFIGQNWRKLFQRRFRGSDSSERIEVSDDTDYRFHKLTAEIQHANGATRVLEIRESPLFDLSGRYVSMEGIAKDVTKTKFTSDGFIQLQQDLELRVRERTAELMESYERLRESELRYRTVVEDQTEFICRWQPGGKYTFVNEAYCRYLDKSQQELLGTVFFSQIYAEDRPRLERQIARLDRGRSSITSECRVYRPDGTIGWNQWTNRVILDSKDLPLEYQSVGRDITDLKNAEDTLREREDHLKRVSHLATMGELIAGISHEMHQPLHAAKLFAEAARRRLEAGTEDSIPTAIDCTNEISEAIDRTVTIIRHLRAITASKPTKFELLDMNQVVQESLDIVAYKTRRAQVHMQLELAKELPTIRGDRLQLQQVFVQILQNAFDAMADQPAKKRILKITTIVKDQYVSTRFCDSGCGVSAQEMSRLFDAFFSTKPEGIGMGLSICNTIAESHHGKIFAQPNESTGMCFTLELPIAQR